MVSQGWAPGAGRRRWDRCPALVLALWRVSPQQFRIERTLGNVGSAATLAALQQDTPLDDLVARWADARAAFMRRRAAALLY